MLLKCRLFKIHSVIDEQLVIFLAMLSASVQGFENIEACHYGRLISHWQI